MQPSRFICVACGTQFAERATPPTTCPICTDDRQHVPAGGQEWTTHEQLLATHHHRLERDGDLIGVGIAGSFAIGQRALLVPSEAGQIMWDCTSLVSPAAVDEISRLGGVDMIAVSHPHFYASMVEWSDAFGGVPIYVHRADERWLQRTSPAVRLWEGDDLELSASARLVHLPGHFPGSTVLHWSDAPNGKQVLLAGDSLHVGADRAHVSVMHSVPNHIPVGPAVIRDIGARLDGVRFDDLYGFTWGRNIVGGADAAVAASLDRYLRAITDSVLAS